MPDNPTPANEFLSQVTSIIERNMANEQFGVSELADAMNMSRSNLLRKVKKDSKLSVSQLINQVRLNRAMEMLRTSSLNVSEVSHQVGFNSTSYFIKCFREYYGYPPGEVGKHPETEILPVHNVSKTKKLWIPVLAGGVVVVLALLFIYRGSKFSTYEVELEKSIAVLPFKNESNDSTNVYLINGLMESTLLNLQKIQDLRVISRTSSEKYRNSAKSIPEMAKELNVRYFVEGSGQKIGDQILLNIQLIEASTDRHLWSNQYKREAKDIFQLQQEIARSIAEEIRAIITTDEKQRIAKKPTENIVAYDLYLKGKNFQLLGGEVNDLKAIEYFKQAIEEDNEFAVAYAETAIAYYYLDFYRAEKKYSEEINQYADKAFLYDSKLGGSLVAKALSYMTKREYESAVPYLEKALEYNPNSVEVIGFLSDFYSIYNPNTGKYLEYALKGVQLDVASLDSTTASYTYLRLGNALIQNGFVEESLVYIDKSLAYNPLNPFAKYVRAFIMFATSKDPKLTRDLLIEEYKKDTTRFDILQDIGKVSYYMRDYKGAYQYYKRFLQIRESQQMDIYRHENLTIAYVLAEVGFQEESDVLVKDYKAFIDEDKSLYKNLGLSAYYTYIGNQNEAIQHMQLFSKEDNVQYWIILFLEEDPLMVTIKDNTEFKKYLNITKSKFWKSHEALKTTLGDKGLLVTH
ncbi:tetratricopeptide repeat protein [Chryseotalea sanaruensis]|uniref:Tetratricopeptide repeat protein n=2 Tax=Chryseotalea sanaruensis TaxID=2482724 RepID=A0A401UD69_9BACT|nr:tetratricopeptide repeat protein [Chryseotalea sanaruensis]